MLNSEPKLYAVEVTEDIATKIRVLAETGVFAAKGGSVEIHFDKLGNISQVVTHTYQKFSTEKLVVKPTRI